MGNQGATTPWPHHLHIKSAKQVPPTCKHTMKNQHKNAETLQAVADGAKWPDNFERYNDDAIALKADAERYRAYRKANAYFEMLNNDRPSCQAKEIEALKAATHVRIPADEYEALRQLQFYTRIPGQEDMVLRFLKEIEDCDHRKNAAIAQQTKETE